MKKKKISKITLCPMSMLFFNVDMILLYPYEMSYEFQIGFGVFMLLSIIFEFLNFVIYQNFRL